VNNILVTGANGQLGTMFKKLALEYKNRSFIFTDADELNLVQNDAVRQWFENNNVSCVINCAAYTAVDKAEEDSVNAVALNSGIPELLGKICLDKNIKLIHFSTDYVFDGESSLPYREVDEPIPLSQYGRSKLLGEQALTNNPNAVIIRTSWLYGEYGNNFMKTILRIASERDFMRVVYDQIGTPTYTGDLAKLVIKIIELSDDGGFVPGLFHFSNEGLASWYDFAWEIINMAGYKCKTVPVSTEEYPLPARRPHFSVLDKKKIKNEFGIEIPYWKESLNNAFKNMTKI